MNDAFKAVTEHRKKQNEDGSQPEDIHISDDEFYAISRRLERYHSVFYQLWELGRPVFTEQVPTAAVAFNKQGRCIEFMFNPIFWKNLTPTQREFVISHECLHVILKHGLRTKDAKNPRGCNFALDVVVNHLLVDKFAFKREDVDPNNDACWIDTVFPGQQIEENREYEYYFNRLPEGWKKEPRLIDIHDLLNGSESDEAIDKLSKSLSEEEKSTLRDMIEKHGGQAKDGDKDAKGQKRGDGAGKQWKFMDVKPVPIKKKWETVIRRWAKKFLPNDFDSYEHWARVNRRMVELPDDCILPTEMELQEKEDLGKIDVWFFLDTSGSCAGLADRFWKAAKSLPPHRFNIKLFCFDTKVYDVDIKVGKLYGFGGTSFDILEAKIQQEMASMPLNKRKYPEAVFVITDGYGNNVYPQIPQRWYWFLSANYRTCIPKTCNIFNLSDFE